MQEENEKQIKYILENFDWDKVHEVMRIAKCQWSDGVPSLKDLKEKAEELLKKAIKYGSEQAYVESGGLRAVCERYQNEDNEPVLFLELLFVVESIEIENQDC